MWPGNQRLRYLAWSMVVGICLIVLQILWRPDLRNPRGHAIGPAQFKLAVLRRFEQNTVPGSRNLLVYPVMTTSDGHREQLVTGDIYVSWPGAPAPYESFTFYADVPFTYQGDGGDVTATVEDYLKGTKRAGDAVPYRYAWWMSQSFTYIVLFGGSVLIFGLLLPLATSSMKEILSKMGQVQPAKEVQTDPSQLVFAEESSETTVQEDVPEQPAPSPAKELETGPLAEQLEQHEADKKYEGEFYPVVRPVHDPKADDD
jgi:hypothetical protein